MNILVGVCFWDLELLAFTRASLSKFCYRIVNMLFFRN